MLVNDFIDYLETEWEDIRFYNGTINKNQDCVGVYVRQGLAPHLALGGPELTSFSSKSLSILIHWSEDANQCELTSSSIYNFLLGKSNVSINGIRIISIEMLDDGPINIERDENNICEMVIRLNIYYDRRKTYEN